MKKLYEIIVALDEVDHPVMAEALLDLSPSTAIYPAKFRWTHSSPGGIRPQWYDCTAVDVGPSTFYLDATFDYVINMPV